MASATYTFTLRLDEAFWEGMEVECVGEAAAIAAARAALQASLDLRPVFASRPRQGAVGVGAGSWLEAPDRVLWLGEWAWSVDQGWNWTSND